MKTAKNKILVLDGMWNKSLAAVRSLGKGGLHVTAGEKTLLATALFSKHCNKRLVYPSPLSQPEEFLNALEQEVRTGAYDAVFPMEFSTQALLTTGGNRERIERYTRVPFADAGLLKRVNDKAFLMKYAKDTGLDIPRTFYADGVEGCAEIADNIKYPVLIKPRVSSGSRGIVCVRVKAELVSCWAGVHEKYPFPIIQEYVPDGGETFGVGLLLNQNSEVRASFVYKRLRSYPVAGGPSTLRESVRRDDVREIAEYLMKSVGWTGVAHVEFKVDPRSGSPILLEVNPRFWGSLQLAIEAGVDFPFLLYRMSVDGDIEPVTEYATGVRCRWLIPGDILHFIKNPERFSLEPGFFDFKVKDDILSLPDPMPVIGRIASVLTFLYNREMRDILLR
jgi:predicted ATP-grasp superfamily ATP-dependent carboligase